MYNRVKTVDHTASKDRLGLGLKNWIKKTVFITVLSIASLFDPLSISAKEKPAQVPVSPNQQNPEKKSPNFPKDVFNFDEKFARFNNPNSGVLLRINYNTDNNFLIFTFNNNGTEEEIKVPLQAMFNNNLLYKTEFKYSNPKSTLTIFNRSDNSLVGSWPVMNGENEYPKYFPQPF